MNKLYYGNGICSIDGTDEIRGVEIKYSGNIKINKLTGNNFAIGKSDHKIIIFPIGEGFLNRLFRYSGKLVIKSVLASDNNAKRVHCSIYKDMAHAELLNTKAEDMTTKSNSLTSSYGSMKMRGEYDGIIKDLYSEDKFYLSDGSLYTGAYHIHLSDSRCMTGVRHTRDSQDLFIKQKLWGKTIERLIPTSNSSHVPQALALRRKRRNKRTRKKERK